MLQYKSTEFQWEWKLARQVELYLDEYFINRIVAKTNNFSQNKWELMQIIREDYE